MQCPSFGVEWHASSSPKSSVLSLPPNARAVITFRPGKENERTISIGAEYVRGDQRTLVNGMEQGRNDYLFRGRYEMMSIVLAIGGAPKRQDVRFARVPIRTSHTDLGVTEECRLRTCRRASRGSA